MPSPVNKLNNSGTFQTSIKSWLNAMASAKRIKPGGRLVFINKQTGTAVPMNDSQPSQNIPDGIAGDQTTQVDPVAEMRSQGSVLGHTTRARR